MDIVKRISEFWNNLTSSPELAIGVAISVVVFTIAYFILISFMIENGSNNLVEIFVLVMVISAVIVSMVKSMNSAIFLLVPGVFVLFIFIVYSVEIKRIVWAKKNAKIMDYKRGEGKSYDKEKIDRCINEIIKALQNMSKNDVGAIIVLACVIFSAFVTTSPNVDTGAATVTMVWKYVGELIFNMLVLVGTIRMSDRIVREMMGL